MQNRYFSRYLKSSEARAISGRWHALRHGSMGLFKRSSKRELTIKDFQEERIKTSMATSISPELIQMLKKSGYGKNAKAGKTQNSIVETVTYRTNGLVWDKKVDVSFTGDEVQSKDIFVGFINEMLNRLETSKETVIERLTQDLLELKNKYWLEENQKLLTQDDFQSKVKLRRIVFASDKSSELHFDDGQMFGGHEITITIDENFEIGKCSI